jgi:hypothetical protein
MADTPENNMDQLLKACARKRREEAGATFELPESTRRVLQAEVARTFPKSATPEPPAWLWLFGFWPRVAYGSGLVALLIVIAVTSLRTEHKDLAPRFDLAKNVESERLSAPKQATPAPVAAGSERQLDLSRNAAAPLITASSPTSERELVQTSTARKSLARLNENATPLTLKPVTPSAPPTADSLALSRAARRGALTADKLEAADGLAEKGASITDAAAPPIDGVKPSSAPAPASAASLVAAESLARAPDKAILGRSVEERPAPLADNKAALDRAAKATPTEPARSEAVLVARGPDAPTASVSNAAQLSYFQNASARGLAEQEAGVLRLQFSRANTRAALRNNRNSPPPITNVLNSFQIQRQGSNILVLDADGSVYEGTIQALAQGLSASASGVALREAPARSAPVQSRFQKDAKLFQKQTVSPLNAADVAEGQNFSFSATGINRSLNQKVVFAGQLRFLQNERIEGKATVGKTELPIEALRVTPRPE